MSGPKIVTPPFGRSKQTKDSPAATETPGRYPTTRMRRNRRDAWSRALVRQAGLTPSDLIWPMFVQEEAAAASKHADE